MNELRVDIGGNVRGFQMATNQAKHIAKEFSGELAGMAKGAAMGLISEEAIRRTVEYGSHVNDLSARLGVSTDTIQKWGYALKMTGSDMSALGPFFAKLAMAKDSAIAGDRKMIESFQKLGVSMKDLKSQRLEDIGMKIADTFKGGNTQELMGTLQEVGGRSAGEFVAAFKEGMGELSTEAERLGLVMSKQTISKLDEVGDKMHQIGSQLMAGIAPLIGFLLDGFNKFYNIVTRISAFAGGFASGGGAEGIAAVRRFNRELQEKEQGKADKKGHSIPGMDADTSELAVKKVKSLEAAQAAYRRQVEATVNVATRLAMEMRDADDLKQAIAKAEAAGDEVEALKLKTELLAKQKQMESSRKEIREQDAKGKTESKVARREAAHVDSLSSAGLFTSFGAVQNHQIDVSQKQLAKLNDIHTAITNVKNIFT